MTKKIDFFCIGSPKAGTTWLFDKLADHDQLFIPKEKEIHYFNTYIPESKSELNPNSLKGSAYLKDKYDSASESLLWGDFSTSYLNDFSCAKKLVEYNNEAKIICLIRHPIERALSHYLFLKQRALIKSITFEQAIIKKPDILSKGLYYNQLRLYFQFFKRENIKILLFDEIITNPEILLHSVECFLGIKHIDRKQLTIAVNPTKKPRFPKITDQLIDLKSKKNERAFYQYLIPLFRPVFNRLITLNSEIEAEEKKLLLNTLNKKYLSLFELDIKSLSELINIDLSHWIRE